MADEREIEIDAQHLLASSPRPSPSPSAFIRVHLRPRASRFFSLRLLRAPRELLLNVRSLPGFQDREQ